MQAAYIAPVQSTVPHAPGTRASTYRDRCHTSGISLLSTGVLTIRRIVIYLILQSEKYVLEVLELQRKIINQRKVISETKAGIIIASDLYKAR